MNAEAPICHCERAQTPSFEPLVQATASKFETRSKIGQENIAEHEKKKHMITSGPICRRERAQAQSLKLLAQTTASESPLESVSAAPRQSVPDLFGRGGWSREGSDPDSVCHPLTRHRNDDGGLSRSRLWRHWHIRCCPHLPAPSSTSTAELFFLSHVSFIYTVRQAYNQMS